MTVQATLLDAPSVANQTPFFGAHDATPDEVSSVESPSESHVEVETVPLPFEAMQAMIKCRVSSVAQLGNGTRRDVVLYRAPRSVDDPRQRANTLRTQAGRHISPGVLLVVDFEEAGTLTREDLCALMDIWDQVESVGGAVFLSGLDVESTMRLREAGVGDYFEIRANATSALSDIAGEALANAT